jgi:hypothetical protein
MKQYLPMLTLALLSGCAVAAENLALPGPAPDQLLTGGVRGRAVSAAEPVAEVLVVTDTSYAPRTLSYADGTFYVQAPEGPRRIFLRHAPTNSAATIFPVVSNGFVHVGDIELLDCDTVTDPQVLLACDLSADPQDPMSPPSGDLGYLESIFGNAIATSTGLYGFFEAPPGYRVSYKTEGDSTTGFTRTATVTNGDEAGGLEVYLDDLQTGTFFRMQEGSVEILLDAPVSNTAEATYLELLGSASQFSLLNGSEVISISGFEFAGQADIQ